MGNPRTPNDKAAVTGQDKKNPGRFADRKTSSRTRPLGEPYANMTSFQIEAWRELQQDIPWLNSSHRIHARLAALLIGELNETGELSNSKIQRLSSILSKLGASPADETKVKHGDDGESDPTDKFFGRPN